MGISAVLITKNEAHNLEACLHSVSWAEEIIVLDSGSTDGTQSLAKKFTPKVYEKVFQDFATQKNAALAYATQDWIFLIDADERVSENLSKEIQTIAKTAPQSCVYEVFRQTFFFNKPLRFSGTQSDRCIRLFPRGKVRYEQPVHEYVVTDLPVRTLEGKLLHYSTRDPEQYRKKLIHYVALERENLKQKGRKIYFWDPILRPIAKFIKLYLLDLGILDGLTGLKFAILSSYYDFLKYSRAELPKS